MGTLLKPNSSAFPAGTGRKFCQFWDVLKTGDLFWEKDGHLPIPGHACSDGDPNFLCLNQVVFVIIKQYFEFLGQNNLTE